MAQCDVCGAETSRAKSPTYAAAEVQRLAANGFLPDEATLARRMTEQNAAREAVVTAWQQQVAQSTQEWLFCAQCANRAAAYRQKTVHKQLPRWALIAIGLVVIAAVVVIVNALIPKAKTRSLGGFDIDRVPISAIAFSPDGSLLAAGDVEHRIKVFDVKTAKAVQTLKDHSATIVGVAFSPDGTQLASAGKENVARLWDVKTGQLLHTLDGHTLAISSVAFSPNGRWIATGGYDQIVNLWDAQTGVLAQTLRGHTDSVTAVAFSPDGKYLASGGQDKVVRVWDLASGQEAMVLEGHDGGLTSVAYSPDGKWLASTGSDRVVKVWNAQTGKVERTLDGFKDNLVGVAFSPDSQQLAIVTDGRVAQLRKMGTWEVLRKFEPLDQFTFSSVAFAPDGSTLALGNSLDVSLWDLEKTQADQ